MAVATEASYCACCPASKGRSGDSSVVVDFERVGVKKMSILTGWSEKNVRLSALKTRDRGMSVVNSEDTHILDFTSVLINVTR